MARSRSEPGVSLGRLVALPLLARSLIDTGTQIFFPFLPILAQGFGLSSIQLGRLLGLRNLTGLTGLFASALADRYGYRRVMRGQLLAGSCGFLLIILPQWEVRVTGLLLSGAATFSFLPTMQAYLSNRLPYAQRARGMGIVEYGWAIASIAGLSTAGWVMERWGWQTPFAGLAVGLLAFFFLFRFLAGRPEGRPTPPSPPGPRFRFKAFFGPQANVRSILATLGLGGVLLFALVNVTFTFGDWLVTAYDLEAGQLGVVALLIGCVDLAGSVATSLFSDRIGKRRALIGGGALSIAALWALPAFEVTVASSVGGLLLVRGLMEFTLVTFIAFASEQAPQRRGRMLALMNACALSGSSLAGFTGPWLLQRRGMAGPSRVSALSLLAGALLVGLWIRENHGPGRRSV